MAEWCELSSHWNMFTSSCSLRFVYQLILTERKSLSLAADISVEALHEILLHFCSADVIDRERPDQDGEELKLLRTVVFLLLSHSPFCWSLRLGLLQPLAHRSYQIMCNTSFLKRKGNLSSLHIVWRHVRLVRCFRYLVTLEDFRKKKKKGAVQTVEDHASKNKAGWKHRKNILLVGFPF